MSADPINGSSYGNKWCILDDQFSFGFFLELILIITFDLVESLW